MGVFSLPPTPIFLSIFRHFSLKFPCLPLASGVHFASIGEKLPKNLGISGSGNTP